MEAIARSIDFFAYIFSSLLVADMKHTKSVLINTHLGSFIHFRYIKMQFVCSFKWFWFLNRVFFWGDVIVFNLLCRDCDEYTAYLEFVGLEKS